MEKTEQEIIKEITKKREFSQLPEIDVKKAFSRFNKKSLLDEEKVKLTRELLHKVFSSFTSPKLLSPKNKTPEWVLRKHLSTRERLPYYDEVYQRILKNFDDNANIIDLGAGINGFSYNFLRKSIAKTKYLAVESIGQLVGLVNDYFSKEKIPGKAIHASLFDLIEIRKIISHAKSPKIALLFKTIDSLEMMENNYSLNLINEITPLVDLVVVSFAVESMVKRKKFRANREWIINFIKNNFKIKDDFEIGGERYICFAEE